MKALAILFLSLLPCYGQGQRDARTCVVTGCVPASASALLALESRHAPPAGHAGPRALRPGVAAGRAGAAPPGRSAPGLRGRHRTAAPRRGAGPGRAAEDAGGAAGGGPGVGAAAPGSLVRRGRPGLRAAPVSAEEQLARELAKTEQLLGGLLDQLDPLFERVDALAGAQQDLLTLRLQTLSQLLKDKGLDTAFAPQEYNPPIHEDQIAEEDDDSDLQTGGWGEAPEEGVTEAWAPNVSWGQLGENGKEWGLRRRKWMEEAQVIH
ncbi:coiled-coil domain-containing protein 107 isoform X2 [Notamacropus eugenii]|uniref:coiled-coil domain-containing protein 107 isoform X2 n=1 Tax=Notamacropus eugenii TaxID=9315 RepID=UPI003B674500